MAPPIIRPALSLVTIVVAVLLPLCAGCGAISGAMAAEQIVVSNYGVAANGMPYAVAMAKGFFKAEGADVDGVLSSAGGGTTVRNLMTGHLAFGEVDLAGTVAAIQQGADLKIVSDDVLTVAEFVWAVKPDSPIKTIQDFKGRKIGYTNPRSTSQGLAMLLLTKAGLKAEDAELVRTGGFGEGVAALETGQIDVAPIAEPLWSQFQSKYRAAARPGTLLPPPTKSVGGR